MGSKMNPIRFTKALVLFALSRLAPAPVWSHSGGLDAKGCHAGSKPYHCHRPQPQRPSSGGGGGCHPNYKGKCVPIASDVDCAGGSGNGPAYVRGPVKVVGPDVYRLDRDGDGWACD